MGLHTIVSIMLELTLIVLAVGLFVLIRELKRRPIHPANLPTSDSTPKIATGMPMYRKRSSIMNKSEMAFFFELQKQLPEGYHIFPNMRIADIIDAVDGKGFYARNKKIMPKHIDFLVCNRYFNPIVAIEVNGSSHLRQDRIESDQLKREIFKDAQLPLEFVDVGTDFASSVAKVIKLAHGT